MIKRVFADGYDRLLILEVNGLDVVASTSDLSDYKLPPLELDMSRCVVSSGFFLKYASTCEEKTDDFKQSIHMSPSTVLTGIIEQVDDDFVTLSTKMLGRVLVELEDDYMGGDVFRGELFIECKFI